MSSLLPEPSDWRQRAAIELERWIERVSAVRARVRDGGSAVGPAIRFALGRLRAEWGAVWVAAYALASALSETEHALGRAVGQTLRALGRIAVTLWTSAVGVTAAIRVALGEAHEALAVVLGETRTAIDDAADEASAAIRVAFRDAWEALRHAFGSATAVTATVVAEAWGAARAQFRTGTDAMETRLHDFADRAPADRPSPIRSVLIGLGFAARGTGSAVVALALGASRAARGTADVAQRGATWVTTTTPPVLDATERVLERAQHATGRAIERASSAITGRWAAPRVVVPPPKVRAPVRWPLRVLGDLGALAAGAALGLGIALGRVWRAASTDVAAYLADPPRPQVSLVWSAPTEVWPGLFIDVDSVAADLLAAGLDRVPPGSELVAGQFSADEHGLEVWSEDTVSALGDTPGIHVRIDVREHLVAAVSGLPPNERLRPPVQLPPTVLGTLGDTETRREPVRLANVSPWLEPALLSMEDERFRSHLGFDLIGIGRALLADARREEVQGGSTLTQQLVKNLFLSPERSLRRKVHELAHAAALEAVLDKDQILELYLSEIYLGQMGSMPLHGAEAAARAWFGRSAAALDVAQAATLVGVIPAPNAWSPVRNPSGALERRNLVLKKMAADGRLSPAQLDAALARPLGIDGLSPSRVRRAPYAFDVAASAAEPFIGPLEEGGYRLHTAIQPLLQRAAEQAIADGLNQLQQENAELTDVQAALVAVRLRDGEVVALVGGRSYADSPFNRATDAHRQVGSTVKPFTMLAAFEQGVAGPNTVLEDAPITRTVLGEKWSPQNFDKEFLGPMTVRRVIERSRNVPSILLAEQVGFGRLQETLRNVGFAEATRLPSVALGAFAATPLEMAGAWTVFDDGVAQRPVVLVGVEHEGGELDVIVASSTRVTSPATAAVATHVLEGVLRAGTGAKASKYGVKPPAAGKSGTTDEFRDAWFVGLTHEYAVAVWVGRDEGLLGLSGSEAALPTWARFVASTGGSTAARERPAGVTSVEICTDSGLRPVETCPNRTFDWVLRSRVPGECTGEHEVLLEEEAPLTEEEEGSIARTGWFSRWRRE